MSIITVEDYTTNVCGENVDYIRSLTSGKNSRMLRAGFIQWNAAEAPSWGGPWDGDYVLFILENHNFRYGPYAITTESVLRARYAAYETYSIYNFPYRLHNTINRIVYVGEQKCSRSELTHQELLDWLNQMTPDEIQQYELNVQKKTAAAINELASTPHIEKPYKFYMCGNDDCSYSAVFATEAEMLVALDDVSNNPSFGTMGKYMFQFTN